MTEERTRVKMAESAWWKMNCDKGRATSVGSDLCSPVGGALYARLDQSVSQFRLIKSETLNP
jgi:hypothetical protein